MSEEETGYPGKPGEMGDPNPGGTGGQGGQGGTGGAGSRGETGETGATGDTGKEGPRGRTPLATKAAYLFLTAGVVAGMWALTYRSEQNIKDNINKTVSELCVAGIPRIKAENELRDVQIEVITGTKKLNLAEGDTARAALNDTYIKALRNAKRHVPTEAECQQELLK